MSDQIRDAFEAWMAEPIDWYFDGAPIPRSHELPEPIRIYAEYGWKAAWPRAYQASRLAALEESQPKWLPIETAPRDGTWILVAGPDQTGAGRMVCRMVAEAWGWESADDGYGAYIQPTHWMALPANPTTERPAKDQP